MFYPSTQYLFEMSFSASNSLSLDIPSTGRKCTVSQCVIQNGDPLVVKKACEASKPQTTTSSSAQSISVPAADSAVTKKKNASGIIPFKEMFLPSYSQLQATLATVKSTVQTTKLSFKVR